MTAPESRLRILGSPSSAAFPSSTLASGWLSSMFPAQWQTFITWNLAGVLDDVAIVIYIDVNFYMYAWYIYIYMMCHSVVKLHQQHHRRFRGTARQETTGARQGCPTRVATTEGHRNRCVRRGGNSMGWGVGRGNRWRGFGRPRTARVGGGVEGG